MISPFFIVGPPRSGTTVLRLALSAHSQIAVPHETSLVSDIIYKYDRNEVVSNLDVFIEDVIATPGFDRVFGLQKQALCELLEETNPALPEALLGKIYSASCGFAEPAEIAVWGDKFIGNSFIIGDLAKAFPESKFVFIKRNPLDSVPSIMAKLTPNYEALNGRVYRLRSASGAALVWSHIVEECEKAQANLTGERLISIRYEDFVKEPTRVLGEVCSFLGLTFESEMLDFHAEKNLKRSIPDESLSKFHQNTRKPISSEFVGRGSDTLSGLKVATVKAICKNGMREYGYTVDQANSPILFGVWVRLLGRFLGSVAKRTLLIKKFAKRVIR